MLRWVGMSPARQPYPSDVSDEEWALVAPYLTLLREDAGQREHALREVFSALRYVVRSGCPWRLRPHDLTPRFAVYRQAQRGLSGGCFEQRAEDPRAVLHLAAGRTPEPTAAMLDGRTSRSSPESGERVGYNGAKCEKGSMLRMAVETLGPLLTRHVTSESTLGRLDVSQFHEKYSRRQRASLYFCSLR